VAVVEGQQRGIRLEGIDAPKHGQAFALESQAHLNALVADKDVSLDCTGVESYNRLICKVLLPGGEDVDLDQIKVGWYGTTSSTNDNSPRLTDPRMVLPKTKLDDSESDYGLTHIPSSPRISARHP